MRIDRFQSTQKARFQEDQELSILYSPFIRHGAFAGTSAFRFSTMACCGFAGPGAFPRASNSCHPLSISRANDQGPAFAPVKDFVLTGFGAKGERTHNQARMLLPTLKKGVHTWMKPCSGGNMDGHITLPWHRKRPALSLHRHSHAMGAVT